MLSNRSRCTLVEKSLYSKASVWSKTSLNRGCVGGIWVDPPTCKMNTTFFLRSLGLSMPIYRNFQSNGAKWPSLKLWKYIYNVPPTQLVFRLVLLHTEAFVWRHISTTAVQNVIFKLQKFVDLISELPFFHSKLSKRVNYPKLRSTGVYYTDDSSS